MRGSKRYNDVGGHSPPGDELENTRDHERIWFELRNKRSCCGCEDPGLRYCFESADYPNRVCNEYTPVNATLIDYFPGSGGVDGGWYLDSKCPAGRQTQSEVGGNPVTFFPDGSWRNGPMFSHDAFGNNARYVDGATWYWNELFPNIDWSFEFFLKPGQSDIDGAKSITTFGYFAGAATNGIATGFGIGGKITLDAPRATNGTTFSSAAGTLVADEWHHVVYVRRTSDGSFSIYVNGKRVIYAKIPTSGFSASGTDQFTFAASQFSQWSDVARYNGALTSIDIVKTTNLLLGAIGDGGNGTGDGNGGVIVEDPGDLIQQLDPSRIDGGGTPGDILTSGGEDAYWESPEESPFELEARKGTAGGYASLDGSALVTETELGSGSPSALNFLRGDRTWSPVPDPPKEMPVDAVVGDIAQFAGDPYHEGLVLAASPLAYWPLQDLLGATTADDVIGTNDLTVAGDLVFENAGGPVTDADLYADFGTTGKLSRAVFSSLTSNFSYSFWFRADTLPAGDRIIFKIGAAGSNGFELQLRASGKLYGLYQGVAFWGESTIALSADTWYHLALVKDGSNLLLYINGSLDTTLSSSAMNVPTGNFQIGNAANDWQMAHFAYFTRVLTSTEIATFYDSRDATGGYWQAIDPATLSIGAGIEASLDDVDVTASVRPRVNFIQGTNVTIAVTDDTVNDEIDVEISASAPAGSGIEVSDNDVDVTAAARSRLDFLDGVGTTAVVTDDAGNDQVKVKFDLPSTSGKADGDVLTLDASLVPAWETPAGGGGGGGWTQIINESGAALTNWTQDAGSWSVDTSTYLIDGAASVWSRLRHSTRITSGVIVQGEFKVDSTGTSRADQRMGFLLGGTGATLGFLGALKWASNNPAANATAYAENFGIAGYTGPAATFAMDTWHTFKVEAHGNVLSLWLNGTLVWSVYLTTTAGQAVDQLVIAVYQAKIRFRNIAVNRLTHP